MGMSLGLSPGLIQSYILYIAKEEGKAGPILSTEGQKPEQEVTQKDSPDEGQQVEISRGNHGEVQKRPICLQERLIQTQS